MKKFGKFLSALLGVLEHAMLVGFLLMLTFSAFAQTERAVDSEIKHVTVFLDRAQITREVKTHIDAGKTNLVLSGLSSQLDEQSIQVSGRGNIVIMGISHQMNFLDESNRPKKIQALIDSIHFYEKERAIEQNQSNILDKEEQLILSNQKIGGAQQNLTVAELKAMADFYRTRLTEIGLAKIKITEKISRLADRIAKLNQQVESQRGLYARNTSEIIVSLSAEGPTTADLEVSYVVANAGWYPVYDVRAINTKNPVQLSYKANVYQDSGEEWNNVNLTLSTANPSLGGLKPELYTWHLDFLDPIASLRKDKSVRIRGNSSLPAAPVYESEKFDAMDSVRPAEFVSVKQVTTTLNTEFVLGLPYSVVSGNKPTMVDIRKYEMKAEYQYAVAPKLDADGFLLAKAVGWESFNLLPGEANVFFEGTFVGKTFIDPNSIKDTLAVSLGRDKRIVVKREKLKDFTSRNTIGANQRDSYAWEISIRNTKNEAVKITVEDHIPVSTNSQIVVSLSDGSGAKYDELTGKLLWEVLLQPNETKKVVYKYEVKYPKDRTVNSNLNF